MKKDCSKGGKNYNKESMEAPKNQKGVGLKSGGMRSAWKGIQRVTDVPPKRSNSGQATVGGAEESVFCKRSTLFLHLFLQA